ncbi:hypothetical protein MATL_G00087290 [Megalops atlanticus]|uniref:Metalloendopeptidase n=1 Tax=Megalops atlanticus TaxID=7932 RepID=A0A9D3Q403_MEGAT|nr:hypothetical protein MATL_G00087290 [Megalops atlanticus]
MLKNEATPVDRASSSENQLDEKAGQVNGSRDTLAGATSNPETDTELVQTEVAVVEGDILLRGYRNAVKKVWKSKNGSVSIFYTINTSLVSRKNDILAAMNMISQKACISFHKRTVEKDYLHFRPGHGCASYVGFWGGAQPIYVARTCLTGNIAHELMHALGFYHEHTRTDRGDHVTVLYKNIIEGRENNFLKRKGDTLGLQYDTESIMHYGERYFSRNGKPTIIAKHGQAIGQRTHLTELDVQRVRKLYKCGVRKDGSGRTETVSSMANLALDVIPVEPTRAPASEHSDCVHLESRELDTTTVPLPQINSESPFSDGSLIPVEGDTLPVSSRHATKAPSSTHTSGMFVSAFPENLNSTVAGESISSALKRQLP